MSVPVASERKSFLPLRLRPTAVVGPRTTTPPMPSVVENNNKSPLTVGNRVVVNGLKNGTLRYIGTVQFAQGLFCGVELDQPEGKHDGLVKDIRYFQCASNHGIFVPRDKVVLAAPRIRTSSSQRPVSRLKPPSMTRSITLSSSMNQIEQPTAVQLPDIVPNLAPQPVTPDETIVNENQETEQSTQETINMPVESQPLPIDETPETIEADFTDSVSLILHQLQQEQQIQTRSSSITISEEDTDDDELDNESVIESTIDEKTRHSSISSAVIPVESTKFVQTDLSFHSHDNISFSKVGLSNEQKIISNSSTSINKLKVNSKNELTNNDKKKPAITPVKKNIERRPVVPLTNSAKRTNISITPRKPSVIPAKKGPLSKTQLNSAQSVTSLPTRSKLSLSLSSSNSVNSSQSDLTSIAKSLNQKRKSDTIRSIDLPSASSEKKLNESRHELDQQLIIQKDINQSLEVNNERLRKQYQHLLNQFDLMLILSRYYINENEQIKQQHEFQLSKAQSIKDQLTTTIEQFQSSHQNDLTVLDKQHQIQIQILNKTHEQQLNECQKRTDDLLHEKSDLESHCASLQEKVDSHLAEMANSEHADALLCHVERLEKDRTSLQTVLELKNREITQLRTKINEQVFQLEDKLALQKRIDKAEKRNQDLACLLREWKLNDKAVDVQRDQLKEQVAQLERDNCQLRFENETLIYRLRQRSLSVSISSNIPRIFISHRKKQIRNRLYSLPLTLTIARKNEPLIRSLSLNCVLNR